MTVARLLELKEGDEIRWNIEPGRGQFVVQIQPLKRKK
jgi:hypothetical protein